MRIAFLGTIYPDQSTNQSIHQSINQITNQPSIHPTNQPSIHQSWLIPFSINRSLNQSNNQQTNQQPSTPSNQLTIHPSIHQIWLIPFSTNSLDLTPGQLRIIVPKFISSISNHTSLYLWFAQYISFHLCQFYKFIFFYFHSWKTLWYHDFSYACFHYRKIFAFVFHSFCKLGAPLRTAVGYALCYWELLFSSQCEDGAATRKHGLTCLEYMVRIVNQRSRIAMKSCQDYVKLFSASTGYKRSPGQLRMCVYFPISCEVASMYRKLPWRRWNPSSTGTPCVGMEGCWTRVPIIGTTIAATILTVTSIGTVDCDSVRLLLCRVPEDYVTIKHYLRHENKLDENKKSAEMSPKRATYGMSQYDNSTTERFPPSKFIWCQCQHIILTCYGGVYIYLLLIVYSERQATCSGSDAKSFLSKDMSGIRYMDRRPSDLAELRQVAPFTNMV